MRYAVPGPVRSDDCPPVATDIAPEPGTASRIAVAGRALISVQFWDDTPADSVASDDPYVRRYWSAAIGPPAVADLLRLIAAARRGNPIPHPLYLHVLASEHLVLRGDGVVAVRDRVPLLSPRHLAGLPVWLRAEHRRMRFDRAA